MKRGGGDFFLSLTLNDFVLTLLFLILLLSLASLARVTRQKEECREQAKDCDLEQVAALRQERDALRRKLEDAGYDPDRVESLVLVSAAEARRLRTLGSKNEELASENRGLETENARLQDENSQLKQKLAGLLPADGSLAWSDPRTCPERLVDAESQSKVCAKQLAARGFGKPPCWSSNGKVQYIYTVRLHEDSVSVRPSWPPERADDALAIPGAKALPGENLSLGTFKSRAKPILAWSKEQKPECRHYVYIEHDAQTVVGFKKNLLVVEDYFYKYLPWDSPLKSESSSANGNVMVTPNTSPLARP